MTMIYNSWLVKIQSLLFKKLFRGAASETLLDTHPCRIRRKLDVRTQLGAVREGVASWGLFSLVFFPLTPAHYWSAAFITHIRWLLMCGEGRGGGLLHHCDQPLSYRQCSVHLCNPKMSFVFNFREDFCTGVLYYLYLYKQNVNHWRKCLPTNPEP